MEEEKSGSRTCICRSGYFCIAQHQMYHYARALCHLEGPKNKVAPVAERLWER